MKLFSLKNKKLIVTALVVVVLGLVIGQAAWGADGGTGNQAPSKLIEVLANIFFYISAALGWLLTFVLGVLLKVAKYNDFLNQAAVTQGWIIVRDICNNFFIVVLLVIAVGTALGVPNYHYKNLLPKLLVMAVLINFSKMFAGIMIDFAQVVMLSFANPLAEADGQAIILAAMNLPAAYNAGDIAISMTGKEYNIFNVLVAMLFALIVSVVALVVIVVIMIVLVYRIVMLWFLVILSPAAFFLSTFPKGQQYSGQWWSMMAKYLVVGPVMVFFLYLSLFTMANIVDKRDSIAAMSDETEVPGLQAIPGQPETSVNGEKRELSFSDLGSEQGVFNFAIIIGLLVGSLVMGQQAGVAGSKWAGKGIGALQKMGKGAAMLPARKAWNVTKGAGQLAAGVGKGIDYASGGKFSEVGRGIKKMGGGAATGAVIGTALGGPVFGTAVGTVVGGLAGPGVSWGINKLSGFLKSNRKRALDSLEGKYTDRDGTEYRMKEIDGKKYRLDENGRFMDSKDKDYEYHEVDGKYYRKNKSGEFVDDGGKVVEMSKAEIEEKNIGANINESKEPRGKLMRDYLAGYYSSPVGKASAAKDMAESERIEKISKDFMSYGKGMLASLLKNEKNKDKQKAIAIAMAMKDAFEDRDQVKKAKESLEGNSVLLKKFNDAVDKKFAHLNYDLDTVAGRAKFAKRKIDGTFDVLNADAYKDDNVIKALQEALTPEEFMNHMKKIGKMSSKHAARLESGFAAAIKKEERVVDAKGMLTPIRQSMINLTNNLAKAFNEEDIKKRRDDVRRGIENKFRRMSANDLIKLDMDVFDKDKNRTVLGDQSDRFTTIVEASAASIGSRTMANLEKNQEASEELIATLHRVRTGTATGEGAGI